MGEINESLSEAGKLLSQTLVLLLKVLFNTTRTTLVAKRPGGRVFTGSHPFSSHPSTSSIMPESSLVSLDLTGSLTEYGDSVLLGTRLLHLGDSLASLDVGSNDLGDPGLVGLLRVLRQPGIGRKLRFLGLSNNGITNRGALALADHLAAPATPLLDHIELRGNAISDDGAAAIAAVLKRTRRLRHISLCQNQIGHYGARALAAALAENPTLHALDLRDNLLEEGELRGLLLHGGRSIPRSASTAVAEPTPSQTALAELSAEPPQRPPPPPPPQPQPQPLALRAREAAPAAPCPSLRRRRTAGRPPRPRPLR